jgi:hypothetical protein
MLMMKKKFFMFFLIIFIIASSTFTSIFYFDFLNNTEKITIKKAESLLKINNIRDFPDTTIYKNETVKIFEGEYPLPIMIPKIDNKNLQILCTTELKEYIYDGREYIPEEEYWMIKCNYF